ncbi:hypothetical protein J2S36_001378 [Arcanobacterium hippocoleae]|uniref:Uncharacterized protein n=1 Tax=Arcanobacterium hippocoleae TaxID=149017 RepID=A0ABU1T371_9ACTO|nr:hypothetical protein [Arcanobacterium hippocoleae]MDR6939835.1 hypothetical protein [Arcanobacterium hippocoleae]
MKRGNALNRVFDAAENQHQIHDAQGRPGFPTGLASLSVSHQLLAQNWE